MNASLDGASDPLTAAFHAALSTYGLIIRTDVNLMTGGPLIYLEGPPRSPRGKPRKLVPVLVGDPGQTLPQMLRMLAAVMEQAHDLPDLTPAVTTPPTAERTER